MIKNFWDETLAVLEENGKTFDDVLYICGNYFCVSKDNFEEVAKKTIYDAGFGSQEIACDLKIVGDCWWMERSEYDGSEGWEFREKNDPPTETFKIHTLQAHNYNYVWDDLGMMQSHDNCLLPGESRFDYSNFQLGTNRL